MPVHDEQEHEVYGGEIPEEEEGEMDTEEYEEHGGEEGAAAGDEELEPGSNSRVLRILRSIFIFNLIEALFGFFFPLYL